MSADPILGPMGADLDETVRECLADADAAQVFEQARWARRAAVLTPTGVLVRAVDLGHAPDRDRYVGDPCHGYHPCSVCGRVWPCPSRRLETHGGVS